MRQSGPYLKTVDRAFQVLLLFDREHPEWSSSELAQALGLHRSIVYRILRSLEQRGFVTQTDRHGRYALGLRLIELGNVVLEGMDLQEVAGPIMNRLVREPGESAFLTVLSGDKAVCIEKTDSPKAIRGVTRCTGRIVEDERIFGGVEFGIGNQIKQIAGTGWQAGGHTVGVVLTPSIYFDGEAMEEEGRYVHPDLNAICQQLGVTGY